jgi:hypothetical protein
MSNTRSFYVDKNYEKTTKTDKHRDFLQLQNTEGRGMCQARTTTKLLGLATSVKVPSIVTKA